MQDLVIKTREDRYIVSADRKEQLLKKMKTEKHIEIQGDIVRVSNIELVTTVEDYNFKHPKDRINTFSTKYTQIEEKAPESGSKTVYNEDGTVSYDWYKFTVNKNEFSKKYARPGYRVIDSDLDKITLAIRVVNGNAKDYMTKCDQYESEKAERK